MCSLLLRRKTKMPDEDQSELERLREENDRLRKFIAESDLDCMYCGLPKADMAKCELGFPGCGRADDLTI